MKQIILLISITIFCTSCSKSNLEILLETMEEETIISAIEFVSYNCEETLAMMEMRYLENPQRVESSREKAQYITKVVDEFQLLVELLRSEESSGSKPIEELIENYKTTLAALEDQIPEGWEDQYTEISRDYYLKSCSKVQLKRIALMMHNDIVLNEAFALKALYYYVDWSD